MSNTHYYTARILFHQSPTRLCDYTMTGHSGALNTSMKPDSLDPDPWSGSNVISRELHELHLELHTARRLRAFHCWTGFHAQLHVQHSTQFGSGSRPCRGKVVLGWSDPDPRSRVESPTDSVVFIDYCQQRDEWASNGSVVTVLPAVNNSHCPVMYLVSDWWNRSFLRNYVRGIAFCLNCLYLLPIMWFSFFNKDRSMLEYK